MFKKRKNGIKLIDRRIIKWIEQWKIDMANKNRNLLQSKGKKFEKNKKFIKYNW